MTALIIDGGLAMAKQRGTQNAADSASLAGTTVLTRGFLGAPISDADVLTAVQQAIDANRSTLTDAEYVDFNRVVVGTVGDGSIPAAARGVRVVAQDVYNTSFGGIAGIHTIGTGGEAIALTGPSRGGTGLLPVTYSVPVEVCDGSSKQLIIGGEWTRVTLETAEAEWANGTFTNLSLVPLCKNGPGGVGWLDLCPQSPPVKLEDQVLGGCGPLSFDIPTWIEQNTGSPSNKKIEDNINSLAGQVVMIPMFDGTCKTAPTGPNLPDCPNPGLAGSGSFYHIPQFAAFLLYEAYTQGTNKVPCNSAPGNPAHGNGSTSCIKGWFVDFVTEGPVGELPAECITDPDKCLVMSVQLVK
jgi:hypothetical protein